MNIYMDNRMKSISMPPHAPTLIESTRAIGYTLESAIADIIDNSISAMASCIDIFFFPVDDSYIAILDNGIGIQADLLDTAMRYGSQNPNNKRDGTDLGRFGLGMKTASLSQCRTLTVVSKQKSHIEARCWDVDHVISTDDWSLLVIETEEDMLQIPRYDDLLELESGTLVVWQNLDRLKVGEIDFNRAMASKMDDVRAHLSLVFHRFISGEPGLRKVQINMNYLPIEPADPFLSKRNTQIMADEVLSIDGAKVIIKPYILPHVSTLSADEISALGGKDGLRKSQGFYVYRGKRLLIWGTWFRMMRQGDLSKLARVQVDIPNELDYLWTLDIKKSTAIPPEEVRNNLDSVIERLSEHSKRTWVFRGKKEMQDSVVHIWQRFKGKQGGYYYSINREHPLLEVFNDAPSQIKDNVENLINNIETGLPLSSLYLDLTADRLIENDTDKTQEEVEMLLKGLLAQAPNYSSKAELLDRLSVSEPFVNYPTLMKKHLTGDEISE